MEFKLECVNKYKNGEYIVLPRAFMNHTTFMNHVRECVKKYDDLGIDRLNP